MDQMPMMGWVLCGGAVLILGVIALAVIAGIVFWVMRRRQQPTQPAARPAPPRPAPRPTAPPSKPDFPLGDSIVTDADIKSLDDLQRYYPLPHGFEYQITAEGVPQVIRSDGYVYDRFVIEADMMTFDEPYPMANGRTGYKTTEVIKITAR
ncbi:MAG: hypothetical protein JW934_15855 [Anaerolineae bacterium]|nr:hypothetical protein [Anaerolineae bacterium]